MPIPQLLTTREMLAAFAYNCEGKSKEAVWNEADRRARAYGLKAKFIGGRRFFYKSSVEAAINSQPDHTYSKAA